MNFDLVNYKISRGVYSSRIAYIKELKNKGFNIVKNLHRFYDCCDKFSSSNKAKVSLKEAFETYVRLIQSFESDQTRENIILIEKRKPLVKQAYEILGVEKVRYFKYNHTSIKREIAKKLEDINLGEIKQQVINKIGYDEEVKISLTKKILKEIYADLNINKKVTTSILNDLFPNRVKEDIRKLNNKSFRIIIIKSL